MVFIVAEIFCRQDENVAPINEFVNQSGNYEVLNSKHSSIATRQIFVTSIFGLEIH